MAQDRRREQYGFEEESWGEEDRRQRYGRTDDWQRRNDEMRRRDQGQGSQQSSQRYGDYGYGSDDYGRGRDSYARGSDREHRAEMGRGYGQGGGEYGSGREYGYGAGGWRGGSDRDWRQSDWRQGDWQKGGYGGGYGGHSEGGRGYGHQEHGGVFGFAAGREQQGNPYADRYGQHSGQQYYGGQDQRYGGQQYGGRQYGGEQRGMWDRASDEVASWFGDDQAHSRRELDQHRGKGPKNYSRSDERIKEDTCDNLAEHPMIDASEIDVKVSSGEVTLDGTVGSRREKRAAEDCVERISGVKHLQNNLRIQNSQSGQTNKVSMGHASYSSPSSGGTSGVGMSGTAPTRTGTGTSGTGSSGSNERR